MNANHRNAAGAGNGTTERTPKSIRAPKASLKVRLVLIVVAVVLALAAAVAAVNWRALAVNNSAVTSLNASIAAYAKEAPDLDKLRNAQQATDAQFRDAQTLSLLQLPSVRATINANAAESKRLTDRIEADAKGPDNADSATLKSAQSSGSSSSNPSNSSNDAKNDQKLDQLLKQNSVTNRKVDPQNVPTGSSSGSSDSGGKTVKPW
ncbi:cell surface protein [Bifidobacterium margollesii]|uniref:Cell surface protein n=1 Tax=Bifidobacterium margollesii TaxID=2020964 RepID=A0A2N5J7G0_9BIFI|nr:DUF6466 family protein [Bifidobacterium margollesii]PLS30136.1 cell surface protein [Bifidobacterium margollesii]